MPKITKIGILSSAKLLAIYGAGVGLVLGILYSFGGAAIDTLVTVGWITTPETPGLSYGTALAFMALIGMPIIFAFPGFILGAFGAFFYNLVSRWFGGLNLDLE
jgi:hypothetical protein